MSASWYTAEVHRRAVALHDEECSDDRCEATVIAAVYGKRAAEVAE